MPTLQDYLNGGYVPQYDPNWNADSGGARNIVGYSLGGPNGGSYNLDANGNPVQWTNADPSTGYVQNYNNQGFFGSLFSSLGGAIQGLAPAATGIAAMYGAGMGFGGLLGAGSTLTGGALAGTAAEGGGAAGTFGAQDALLGSGDLTPLANPGLNPAFDTLGSLTSTAVPATVGQGATLTGMGLGTGAAAAGMLGGATTAAGELIGAGTAAEGAAALGGAAGGSAIPGLSSLLSGAGGVAQVLGGIQGINGSANKAAAAAADPFASQRGKYQDMLSQLMSGTLPQGAIPGLNFGLSTGLSGLAAAQSRQGNLASGNALNQAQQYGQQYGLSQFNTQESQLAGLAGATSGAPGTAGAIIQSGQGSTLGGINSVLSGVNTLNNSGALSGAGTTLQNIFNSIGS